MEELNLLRSKSWLERIFDRIARKYTDIELKRLEDGVSGILIAPAIGGGEASKVQTTVLLAFMLPLYAVIFIINMIPVQYFFLTLTIVMFIMTLEIVGVYLFKDYINKQVLNYDFLISKTVIGRDIIYEQLKVEEKHLIIVPEIPIELEDEVTEEDIQGWKTVTELRQTLAMITSTKKKENNVEKPSKRGRRRKEIKIEEIKEGEDVGEVEASAGGIEEEV